MAKRVLVTGGAGFIGSHVCDELVTHGYDVIVLDSMEAQVHGELGLVPQYLPRDIEFTRSNVADLRTVRSVLVGVDAVIHLAAKVGVGQSAYQPSDYVFNNSYGTGVLLQALAEHKPTKLIAASSMSVYGEGAKVPDRHDDSLSVPLPTPEGKWVDLQSVYALTKYDQERLCLLFGRAYNVPTVALRFFNVYGPRQSLNNPYTGVMAIFASRLLNDKRPIVFEDGLQRRDFVYVTDVAKAVRLALECDVSNEVINIGSGTSQTIIQVAEVLATALGKDIIPTITGQHRVGDIRHCFAEISKARDLLGYNPSVSFSEGVAMYVEWLKSQQAEDNTPTAIVELEAKGLLK